MVLGFGVPRNPDLWGSEGAFPMICETEAGPTLSSVSLVGAAGDLDPCFDPC